MRSLAVSRKASEPNRFGRQFSKTLIAKSTSSKRLAISSLPASRVKLSLVAWAWAKIFLINS